MNPAATVHPTRRRRPWLALAAALGLALASLLPGCGGVGSEGTGDMAIASGPITGFGSVIVNGVHYDETAAALENDEGQALAADALALGMVVQVEAGERRTEADGSLAARASRIAVRRALLGPVGAVDAAAGRLTVLGQQVQVTDATVFDAALGAALSAVAAGTLVEVHGAYDATLPGWRATRLALAPAGASWSVRGPAEAIDALAQTLTIGSQTYRYDAAALGAVSAGQLLRLTLQPQPDDAGRWRVAGRRPDDEAPGEGRQADWRGVIQSMTSARRFALPGLAVDASAASVRGTLGVGVEVKVEGRLLAGVLQATRVEVEDDDDAGGRTPRIEVRGVVSLWDAASLTLRLRDEAGRETTALLHSPQLQLSGGTLAGLRAGVRVKLEGTPAGDDRRRLLALRLSFL